MSKESDLIRLTGLWQSQMKNGDDYLSGSLGAARLTIFPNRHRRSDKEPTHILYISPAERRDAPQQQNQTDEPW